MTSAELMEDLLQMLDVATDDMKLKPDQVLNAALGVVAVYTCARFENPDDVLLKALSAVSADALRATVELKGAPAAKTVGDLKQRLFSAQKGKG